MRHVTAFARTFGIAIALVGCAAPAFAQAQEAGQQTPQSPPIPKTAVEPRGFIAEPIPVQRAVIFGERMITGNGGSAGFGFGVVDVVPGSGWIAVGPTYRRWGSNDRSLLHAGAGLSWRGYKTADLRFEMLKLANGRVSAGAAYRWQDFTQIPHFGQGPDSDGSAVSEYRLRSNNVVGFAVYRPIRWLGIGTSLGVLKPSLLPPAGLFRRDRPDTAVAFADDPTFGLTTQPAFLTADVSITADTRDFPGHTLRGSLVHLAATQYSDQDTGIASFRRVEADVTQFVPIAGGRVVLAAQGWFAGARATEGNGGFVPFYLQPTIGGANSLRSYHDYRFHDLNAAGVTIETRIALMTHLDVALFADAGNVASRAADLNLDKRSFGAGVRLHSRRMTYTRIDVAHGREGWRFLFRLTDPLAFSRISRKTAVLPFLPK